MAQLLSLHAAGISHTGTLCSGSNRNVVPMALNVTLTPEYIV